MTPPAVVIPCDCICPCLHFALISGTNLNKNWQIFMSMSESICICFLYGAFLKTTTVNLIWFDDIYSSPVTQQHCAVGMTNLHSLFFTGCRSLIEMLLPQIHRVLLDTCQFQARLWLTDFHLCRCRCISSPVQSSCLTGPKRDVPRVWLCRSMMRNSLAFQIRVPKLRFGNSEF